MHSLGHKPFCAPGNGFIRSVTIENYEEMRDYGAFME